MKKIFLLIFILSVTLSYGRKYTPDIFIETHMDMPKIQDFPHILLPSGHSYGMKEKIDLRDLNNVKVSLEKTSAPTGTDTSIAETQKLTNE